MSLLKKFTNFDKNLRGLFMRLGVLIVYPIRMSKFYIINCLILAVRSAKS